MNTVEELLFLFLLLVLGTIYFGYLVHKEWRSWKDSQRGKEAMGDVVVDRLSRKIGVTLVDLKRYANAKKLSSKEAKHVVEELYSQELSERVDEDVLRSLGKAVVRSRDRAAV